MAFDAPLKASDEAKATTQAATELARTLRLQREREEQVQAEIRRMLYRRGC